MITVTKVLVIEDDRDIRDTIADTLTFAGYEVAHAEDGVTGIAVARECDPDLILCDIMMPGRDGYEVLSKLNEHPRTVSTPFIFLTARSTKEDRRKGMSLGADDYLVKPFSAKELLIAVESRLRRHSKLKKYNLDEMDSVRQYLNYTIPHELRTPLSGILGYLEMLENDFDSLEPDLVKRMFHQMGISARRLSKTVEDFITYSQVKLVKSEPEVWQKVQAFSEVNEFELLLKQVVTKEAAVSNREGDLIVDVEPGRVEIFIDHGEKLIQTVANNAFKFSQPGSCVKLTGVKKVGVYEFTFSNEGRGMTEEQIARIGINNQFERNKYEQQGAGLGLATAQAIVELYNGRLSIKSEPGKITAVSVTLNLL